MLNRLQSLQAQGKLESSRDSFKRILQSAPQHLHALIGLCYCASLEGDQEGALRSIGAAIAAGPTDEAGIIACSEALWHLGRLGDARDLLAASPKTLLLQIKLGELDERQGHHELALACYEAAHELDAKADLPLQKLISLHRRQGAFATAFVLVDRFAGIDKQHQALAWHFKAQIHSAAGEREAAIEALRTGVDLPPHAHSEACAADLARELRQLRRLDEARAVLLDRPATYTLLLVLSDLELSCRDHAAALHYAAAARAQEPRKPDALRRMVQIEVDRRDFAAAHAAADQLGAIGPEHKVTALRCHVDTFKAAGEEQECLSVLQELAVLQPADVGILTMLSRHYRATGNGAAARRTLETALTRRPDDVAVLTEAGEQANALEDRETALGHFQRVQALAPDHAGHHLRVMQLLYDLGETEEAHRLYQATESRFSRTADVWGARIRILRETGELHQALAEARQAHNAYPAHFGRWADCFDLEFKLSSIDVVLKCLDQAPVQTCHEEVRHLAAKARLALRIYDEKQGIMLLEQALRLLPNDRGVLNTLFSQHVKTLDIDKAVACHVLITALDKPARQIRGTTTNASQSHEGQMLNDLLIDRRALTELMAIKALDPMHRISALLSLAKKRPDHIPTAAMILVALREEGFFNGPVGAGPAVKQTTNIPRIIGQFWDAIIPPPDLSDLSKTWRDGNPGYRHVLFNEESARDYLAAHFPAAVVKAYLHCTDATTKADLFRLAFLDHDGGVWVDMDDRCIRPLSEIIPDEAEAFFWQENTGHLCNNLMAAKAGHPILRRALVAAVNAINRGDRDKVWMLTGPGLLSRAFVADMAEAGDDWREYLNRIHVLDEFSIWSHVAIHCRTSHKRLGKHWLKTAYSGSQSRPERLSA